MVLSLDGTIRRFGNAGDTLSLAVEVQTGIDDREDGIDARTRAAPARVDPNGDGRARAID